MAAAAAAGATLCWAGVVCMYAGSANVLLLTTTSTLRSMSTCGSGGFDCGLINRNRTINSTGFPAQQNPEQAYQPSRTPNRLTIAAEPNRLTSLEEPALINPAEKLTSLSTQQNP